MRFFGWAIALLLCFSGRALALPAETWLLSIGNNVGDRDEVGLRFAERDAHQFADVVRQQGGVSSFRIRMLLGEDAASVRRSIEDLNAEIRERIRPGQPSALVIFYSGHADVSSLHLRGTHLLLEELRKLVQGSPAGVRLLIVDACRSGNITRVKGVRPAPAFEIRQEEIGGAEGLAIITSSAAGESSQESDQLRGSFFSHHLVNALRGAADRNGDGRVTLNEAYGYTYEQTLRSSGRTLELQHPTYAISLRGRQEVVLTQSWDLRSAQGQGQGQGRMSRLRLLAPSLYLISEERDGGSLIAEVFPAKDNTALHLPSGEYFVQQRLQREYREYQVRLPPMGEVSLSAFSYRPVQYDRLVRKRGSTKGSAHGLSLLGGIRGPLLEGQNVAGQVFLGYGVDLPWLSVGARLRGGFADGLSQDRLLAQRDYEVGLSVLVQRFVDLRWFSLAFGLTTEVLLHRQEFVSERMVVPRTSLAFSFGGLLAGEVPLGVGLSLRVEAGPLTQVYQRSVIDNGAEAGQEIASTFTGFCAAGFTWRH